MGRFYYFIIVIVLIALIIIFTFIISAYKKCPPGHVLIINNNKPDAFGNMYKILFAGGAFVWPVVGSYQLFSLAPVTLDLNIQDFITKNQQNLDMELSVIIGFSTSETILKNAIDRFSGLSKDKLSEIAQSIALGQIRKLVSDTETSDIENITSFNKALSKEIEGELMEVGLKLINLDIKKIIKT